MEGYDSSTYGERFADVYDDWYGDLTDNEACVAEVRRLADGGPVLELGVGTGRLAVPLAAAGLAVTGVDSSPAMLAALKAKTGGRAVTAVLGDMTAPPVGDQRFAVVLVAYNTLFNLVADGDQARCLSAAARLLVPGGVVVVEAFVPEAGAGRSDDVTARTVTADRVVLSVSRTDQAAQEVLGQFVEITEGGIQLRPWHVRWSTPDQLDQMASAAGLRLDGRSQDWSGTPFTSESPAHVSRYRPL